MNRLLAGSTLVPAMLDLREIRTDPAGTLARLRRRDPTLDLAPLLALDEERRLLTQKVDDLRRQQNEASERIAILGRESRHADKEPLLAQMRDVAAERKEAEARLQVVERELESQVLALPNIPHDSVPDGTKEEKVILRTHGDKPRFAFPPQHHVALAQNLGLLDLERAAKVTGARFPMYTGLGARLEFALLHWMFELHVREHGYIPILPPILANRASFVTSGQFPKFASEVYACPEDDLFLNPTAEALLVNLHRDELLSEAELPRRYVAYTPCFRREAGTYGEEQRGLIRVHQFNKVELFHYTKPEASYAALDEIVLHAETILQRLGLHYRVALLPAGDLAQQASKTVDVEVWLPGQERYYEVSSCSNCEDYQARRGNIRYRPAGGGKPRFVHTLNGSALATSRLFAAILEQNQTEDGTVLLPAVLADLLGQKTLP
ncbi:MAG: Seryl-tRNA synthetase [Candidatus Bipolaricaulis sibiricus]|uniref:Serine--tRNA ligase n=1 Tax=Bipolaricaulis sibiricus TaxID=2501609 RepID=A0A410FVK0_BIPS1|nr:MAG: Seryl-tRNA synthetase [Candidatus Bipolaricaulis sibiricus]